MASAQLVTNWIAFNDYVPGPLPNPAVNNNWGTASNVNVFNLRGIVGTPPEPTTGTLRDYLSGDLTPANIVCTANGTPDFFGAISYPNAGTPAFNLFNGLVDLGNANSAIGVRFQGGDVPRTSTTITFNNLDPTRRYVFRGTSVRGNNYLGRWTLVTLLGAESFTNAHSANVYTMETFPTGTMTNGQAAWNSGENRAEGAVVGWDAIAPGPDGSFSILNEQYVDNPLPNGQPPTLSNYGYAICGFMLAEIGPPEMVSITVQPAAQTTVEEFRPFSLSVSARGAPTPTYQWYKQGLGAIPGATGRIYSVASAQTNDSGNYFVVVSNPLNSVTSIVARVTVNEDITPPRVLRAVGNATLDRIYVEFSEVMDSLTTTDGVNYAISPPLNLTGFAVMSSSGKGVFLPTDPQTPGTLYTVTVNDVYDLAGNNVASPNNTAQFRAWVPSQCGGLTFEVYNGTPGPITIGLIVSTAVSVLTNHPTFPNNPSEVFKLSTFSSRGAYADDSHENYGGRIRGLFIPPESGNWKFYMRGDDGAEVWFNPNGISPSGRVRICQQGGFVAGAFAEETPGTRTSAPIPLTAGQAYYIEMLYQEQGGGDYGEVAAKLETDPTPAASLTPIPGTQLGIPSAPPNVVGAVVIAQQPASRTNEANTKATFSVVASNAVSAPICYQWQKSDDAGANFSDIPGATGPSFTTGYLKLPDDNGDVYRVVVAVIGSSLTSANAVLTVTPDRTRPRVTRVLGINTTNIVVIYSEPMPPQIEGGTVDDPFAYEIGGLPPAGAAINAGNPLRVDLSLDPANALTLGTVYTLRISTDATAIMDANMNLIDPNPTIVMFRAQLFPGDANNLVELPTSGRLPVGTLTARGFAGRIVQVPVVINNLNSIAESMLDGTFINPGTGLPALNIAPLPFFYETNIINYNKDMPTNVYTGSLTPDIQFPGYPPNPTGAATAGYENMAMEVVAYLHLQTGVHSFGVNSDDGFRVSPATSVSDPNNSITLGEFNGARGAADTIFNFYVSQEGLYPLRLIWEQGQGGGNVEWWAIDLNTTGAPRFGINANVSGVAGPGGGGPPAFTPPCTPKTLSVSRAGTNLMVSWPIAGAGNQFGLQGTPSLNPAIAWSAVPQVAQNVSGNKRVTIPLSSTNRFYRLYKPAPPNCN